MENPESLQQKLCFRGGAEMPGCHGGATLVVKQNSLIFFILFARYRLSPEQVVSIVEVEGGIEIHTAVCKAPTRILFRTQTPREQLIHAFQSRGFSTSEQFGGQPNRNDSPVKKAFSRSANFVWHVLLLSPIILNYIQNPNSRNLTTLLNFDEQIGHLIALFLGSVIPILLMCSPLIKKIALKPDRHIEEISVLLGAFSFMTSILFVGFWAEAMDLQFFNQYFFFIFILTGCSLLFWHRLRAFFSEGV